MSVNLGSANASINLNYNSFKQGIEYVKSALKGTEDEVKTFKSTVEKTAEFPKFREGLKTTSKDLEAFGDKMKTKGTELMKLGGKMSLALTAPLVAIGKSSFSAASDYEENINKIDVVFGKYAEDIIKFSESATKNFGLSKNTSLEMIALFGDMSTAMGLSVKDATDMSVSLAGLAGDIASFKNMELSEVQTALSGIFTGETESLKRLGIVMTETNLEQYAMSKGYETLYKDMSQAEKVQLRYNYVLDASKNAQGDYARTADGTANSTRTFMEELENLKITMGKHLLPIITPIIRKFTDMITKFSKASPEIQKLVVKLAGLLAVTGPLLTLTGSMTRNIGTLSSASGKLIGKIAGSEKASIKLFNILKANPYLALAAGVAAVSVVLYDQIKAMHQYTDEAKKMSRENEQQIESTKAQFENADILVSKLENLNSVEHKTKSQKEQMKTLVDELNESVEGLGLTYDEEADSLNMSTSAIKENIEQKKKQMLQDIYMEQAQKALEKKIKTEQKMLDVEKEIAQKEKEISENRDPRKVNRLNGELESLNATYEDLSKSQGLYVQESVKAVNQAQIESGAWDELLKQAKITSENLAPTLIEGIKNGTYQIPETVEELNGLIKFDMAVTNAGLQGTDIVSNLSQKILDGEMTVEEATAEIIKESKKGVESRGVTKGFNAIGMRVSQEIAGGILEGGGAIVDAVGSIANLALRSVKPKGSHRYGLEYVPYDGYTATLHEGERVLTKSQAKEYNQGNTINNNGGDTFNFYSTIPSPYEYARQVKRAKKELSF